MATDGIRYTVPVAGPHFVAVHTMLDPQVDGVRGMVGDVAERIATPGGSPSGAPGRASESTESIRS